MSAARDRMACRRALASGSFLSLLVSAASKEAASTPPGPRSEPTTGEDTHTHTPLPLLLLLLLPL